jgi:hypothetical protein
MVGIKALDLLMAPGNPFYGVQHKIKNLEGTQGLTCSLLD